MVLVKAKAATFDSDCAREGCERKIKTGSSYAYDTEAKKGYCSVECGEMVSGLKAVDNGFSKKSSWTPKPLTELWRKPEEALTATKIWHETIIPMIIETAKKLSPSSTAKNGPVDKKNFEQISRLYEEIFLGKMQGGSKN